MPLYHVAPTGALPHTIDLIQRQGVPRFRDEAERDQQYPRPDVDALCVVSGDLQHWTGRGWVSLLDRGPGVINQLRDVNALNPADGDPLVWSSAAQAWVAGATHTIRLILNDPLDTTANWTGAGTTVAGRHGNGMGFTGTGSALYTIPLGPLRTDGETVSFSWRINTLAAVRPICSFNTGGEVSPTVTLVANTNGSLSLLTGGTTGGVIGTTSAGVVTFNTWYTIEVAVHIGETLHGMVRLKVNDVTGILVFGADTQISTSSILDSFTLRGGGSGAVAVFDDFLLTTADPTW